MRKSITVSLSHDLPPQEIKRRIENGIAEARIRHGDALKGAQENWTSDDRMDFTARAMGQSIGGSVRIEQKFVHVTVSLPLLLAMFASKLTQRIESDGRKMLE